MVTVWPESPVAKKGEEALSAAVEAPAVEAKEVAERVPQVVASAETARWRVAGAMEAEG